MACAHDFGTWCPECLDGLVAACNNAQRELAELRAVATYRLSAHPVGEPAPMPPLEVGDWVNLATRYETDVTYILSGIVRVASEVEADNFNQRGHWYRPLALAIQAAPDIAEIRKADGRVWRRADRKEPGQ